MSLQDPATRQVRFKTRMDWQIRAAQSSIFSTVVWSWAERSRPGWRLYSTSEHSPLVQWQVVLMQQHGNTWFGTIQFQVRTIQIQVVTRELQLGTVWFQGQDNKFRNSESVFCPKFRNYLVINILEAHSCELWFTHEKLQFSVILELSGTNLFGTREF